MLWDQWPDVVCFVSISAPIFVDTAQTIIWIMFISKMYTIVNALFIQYQFVWNNTGNM